MAILKKKPADAFVLPTLLDSSPDTRRSLPNRLNSAPFFPASERKLAI
ncbi:hypothetical protein GGD67_003619 [Bradyrhizobium sp. IAR9]|nr:hypothetical protein [Bradyrhizobium sp. IAR9]